MSEERRDKKIVLRIDPINELLSERPRWIIRYGSTILLIAVALLIWFSGRIEFRDNISVTAEIVYDSKSDNLTTDVMIPDYISQKSLRNFPATLYIKSQDSGSDLKINCKALLFKRSDITVEGNRSYIFILSLPETDPFIEEVKSGTEAQGRLEFTVRVSLAERVFNSL